LHRRKRSEWLNCGDGLRFRSHDVRSHREGAGDIVGSHMFQHVGCRLNRSLTHLVYADRVAAIFASHRNAACNAFGPDIHALSLRFNRGRCRGHWDSDHGLWPRVSTTEDRRVMANDCPASYVQASPTMTASLTRIARTYSPRDQFWYAAIIFCNVS
jgi:hypothetical protein